MVYRKLPAEVAERIQRRMESPNGRGMIRLCNILEGARTDPEIAAARPALECIDIILEIVGDALSATGADDAFAPFLSAIEAEKQRMRASKKRNRSKPTSTGKAFVAAVKRASGRRSSHTAWGWIECNVDEVFGDGFEIVACNDSSVEYRYQSGKKQALKRTTFDKYWRGEG